MNEKNWHTPSNRKFKKGDKVFISNSSNLLTSHTTVRDRVGKVIGFVQQEKTLDIIRVQYEDYEYIVSGYSGEFEAAEL
jgi:hypothetical protein